MSLLILKIATVFMLTVGFALLVTAMFLVRKILKISVQKTAPMRSESEAQAQAEFLRKIEAEFVLIPRLGAAALARSITEANIVGYKITNRIDKSDLRNVVSKRTSTDELLTVLGSHSVENI